MQKCTCIFIKYKAGLNAVWNSCYLQEVIRAIQYSVSFWKLTGLKLDWTDKIEGYLLFKQHSSQKHIMFIASCCLLITKSNYSLTSTPTNFNETSQKIRQAPSYIRFGSFLMKCSGGNKTIWPVNRGSYLTWKPKEKRCTLLSTTVVPSMPGFWNFTASVYLHKTIRSPHGKWPPSGDFFISLFIYSFDKKFESPAFIILVITQGLGL